MLQKQHLLCAGLLALIGLLLVLGSVLRSMHTSADQTLKSTTSPSSVELEELKHASYLKGGTTIFDFDVPSQYPAGWVREKVTNVGFSIMVPPGWVFDDSGHAMVSGTALSNDHDRSQYVDVSLDGFDQACGEHCSLLEVAQGSLLNVWPISVHGVRGYLGVAANPRVLYAENTIALQEGAHYYGVSFPSMPSDDIKKMIASIEFFLAPWMRE